FALERWREIDAEHLIYESVKPGPGGRISLMLTPLERIERLAALIPPPRRHRHRYYGVLAPNAPLRAQVIALAGVQDSTPAAAATESIAATIAPSTTPSRAFEGTEEAPGEAEAIHRRAARCAWALLLARIDEVFPLVCPRCGGERRIIAFIIEASAVRNILTHLGEPTSPPRLMRARAPPLWEMQGATTGEDDPPGSIGAGVRIRSAHRLVGAGLKVQSANAQRSKPKQDELPSPVVGRLVLVAIRPARPARRMATSTERGGIRMTFQGLPGRNSSP
ncbi:MAG: transposase, partial [Candidatus Accumulibacter phosphatis]|nr:transposase [Candidatus Accumulibacter phosphatis]